MHFYFNRNYTNLMHPFVHYNEIILFIIFKCLHLTINLGFVFFSIYDEWNLSRIPTVSPKTAFHMLLTSSLIEFSHPEHFLQYFKWNVRKQLYEMSKTFGKVFFLNFTLPWCFYSLQSNQSYILQHEP